MTAPIPTTTVVPCPKCGTRARLREGDDSARCEACNTVVHRGATSPSAGGGMDDAAWQKNVLIASVALFAVGLAAFAFGRRPRGMGADGAASSASATQQVQPSLRTPALTATPEGTAPAGELAWIAEARGPLVVDLDGDGIEDVFGFFRVWDGRSAWTTYAGAFKGTTLEPLWRTEALDPWLVRREGIVPTALVVGKRILVADATETVRVYRATGEKDATFQLAQPPRALCKPGEASRVWIDLDQPVTLDLDTGKTQPSPAPPAACAKTRAGDPAASRGLHPGDAGKSDAAANAERARAACNDDFRNRFSHAACVPPDVVPRVSELVVSYGLSDGKLAIAAGLAGDAPTLIGYTAAGKVLWTRGVPSDTKTRSSNLVPRIADLANERLYVMYDKLYFDSRLEAIDATTGATLWDVPLVGSLPRNDAFGARGEARAVAVSLARVYVARAGGGLDVFDAKSGATVGSIGNK